MTSQRTRAHPMLAPAAVVAAGGALRFATLSGRGFWTDETATILAIRRGFGGMLTQVADKERSPPLYYVLAWVWTRVFGTGEPGLRSLSALIGTLTIAVAYAIGARLISRRVGLIAASIVATSPLMVWYSLEARTYALFALLVGLSFLLFLNVIETGSSRALAGWAVVSALALAAHYFALFPVLCEAAWLIGRQRSRNRRLLAVGFVVAVGSALLPLALHQRSVHPFNAGVEETALWRRIAEAVAWFLAGPQPPTPWASTALAGGFVLCGGWLVWRRTRRQELARLRAAAAISVASIGIPLLFVAIHLDYWATRNVVFVLIFLAVLAAGGFASTRLGFAAAAGLCAISLFIDVATADTPKFDREDWRGAARAVGASEARRAIVLTPAIGAETFLYYHPCASIASDGSARLREIDVIGLPRDKHALASLPGPPRPASLRPPAAGFVESSRNEAAYFTLIRFTSTAGTRAVRLADLAQHAIDDREAAVLLDGTC